MSYYNKRWHGRGGHQDIRPRNPLAQSEESPPPPLGELIEIINQKDLEDAYEGNVVFGITESDVVASYNWADQKAPKIMVPGRPPLWTPLEKPRALLEDNGVYFRDNNSAFFPKHPLEPAIVATMKMHPTSLHIDLVACNSTIGNLLRFVQGTLVRGVDRSFRMIVEVMGKTVHFIRRENSPTEQIMGVRGFGHAFPEAYTTWTPDVRPSKSHHRLIRYKFGGLDILLRSSADGYIEEKDTHALAVGKSASVGDKDLTSVFENVSIGTSSASPADAGNLEVVDGGQPTSQQSVFDLKTRSIKLIENDTLAEELPRLWLARIPNFILAHHTRGTFNKIEIADVREDVQDWEKSHQQDLSRLSTLLHRIIATALEKEGTLLEIVKSQGGPLEIRKRLPDAGVAFSDQVKDQWLQWLGHSDDVEEADDGGEKCGDCGSDSDSDSDSDGGDFTACNEECGYCGKCRS
ncbi:hypothetical protein T069G_06518 [Trichoderma breve]|uniref:Geranylgeranyl pyrophosphate synthetase n=1 Tax=Trichoderma breve TaxID=2034170 RepID=A0A9W9BES3_9HYPO|nr:hypothetical protein T069G_06518 [Trichoderma breve]KAJ4858251.1 hypothetical protein T069G_06518 [Trichoderma breve]